MQDFLRQMKNKLKCQQKYIAIFSSKVYVNTFWNPQIQDIKSP